MKKNNKQIFIRLRVSVCLLGLSMLYSVTSFGHWSTRGPYGGSVSSLMVMDTTIFMGSPTGGVYSSTNTQLTTWVYRNYVGLGSGKITAFTYLGSKVLAATSDSGVYVSADKGLNWSKSNSGLSNLNVKALLTSSGKIYAGTAGGGIFRSADSGATWTTANSGLGNMNVNTFAALGDTLIAGTNGGIFISLNAGGTWTAFNSGLSNITVSTLVASASGSNIHVFAGTPTGIFKGSASFTWSAVNTGLGNTTVNTLLIYADSVYAGTNQGIFYMSVDGSLWNMAGSATYTCTVLASYGNKMLAGTSNNGIYKATAGSYNWTAINTGFNNLKTFAAAAKDSLVAVANEQGVFVCKNFVKSAVYVKANAGLNDSLHVNALLMVQDKLFAGTANAGMFVSADTGASWSTINTGLSSFNVRKLASSGNKLWLATADGKFFSSLLTGISWTENSSGLPGSLNITSLTATGDTVFIGSPSGVYASISGSAWSSAGYTQPVTSLAISGNYLFAGNHGAGVFRKKLDGNTWSAVNTGLADLKIEALAGVDTYVVAGYKGGAMTSCNGGNTWDPFNTLQYIPNYASITGFTHIKPRIFAITSEHGLLGNSKAEFPDAVPDTPSIITGLTEICKDRTVSFAVTNDAKANTYFWTLPANCTGSSDSNAISVYTADTGMGTIAVHTVNGCGSSAIRTLQINVVLCTGINAPVVQQAEVYPNPFAQQLVITANGAGIRFIQLTDMQGKNVLQTQATGNRTVIETGGIGRGVYILQITTDDNSVQIKKVIKTAY